MNKDLPNKNLPSRSWEIIAHALDFFGIPRLQKITGLQPAQIYRYAKNPDVYDDASPNHIDRVQILLRKIAEEGGEEGRDVAKIALNLIAQDCGLKVVDIEPAKPITGSPRAEFLALHNRLHELQAVAQNQDDPLIVEAYADKVKDSLSGFLVRYTVDYQEQGGKVRFCKTKPSEAKPASFWANFWPFGR